MLRLEHATPVRSAGGFQFSHRASWRRLILFLWIVISVGHQCVFAQGPLNRPATDSVRVIRPSVDVDWRVAEVELQTSVEQLETPFSLRLSRRRLAGQSPPRLTYENGALSVAGSIGAILAALQPETRSLWLEQRVSGRRYRVDLPPVAIRGLSTKRIKGSTDHLVLNLFVEGLLPGFQIFAQVGKGVDGEDSPARLVEATPGGPAQLLGLPIPPDRASTEHTTLRILLPAHAAEAALRYDFTIVNPEGSHSRTIRIRHAGRSIAKRARFVNSAYPAPIDQQVRVPDLELETVQAAYDRAVRAGFVPWIVDETTFQQTDPAGIEQELIVRQGLAPNSPALAGQRLLLAVGGAAAPHVDVKAADVSPRADFSAIDLDAALGFVDAPVGETLFDLSESGLDPALSTVAEHGPGDAPESLAADLPPDAAAGSGTIVPLAVEPRVNLNPLESEQQATAADAVLKAVLSELTTHSRGGAATAEGKLAQALQAAQEVEQESLAALQGRGSLAAVPIQKILDRLTAGLGLRIDASTRQAALADWRAAFQHRAHPYLMDHNRNGRASDDIAVWLLLWLHRRGEFNPRSHIAVQGGGRGVPVAILGASKRDQLASAGDWAKVVAEFGGGATGSNTVRSRARRARDTAGRGNLSVSEETITVRLPPKGPAKTRGSSTPDRTRVPQLRNRPIGEALAKLKRVNLRVSQGKFLSTDVVVDSNPAADRWVRPEEQIELVVKRRVPDLREKSFSEALDLIRQRGFKVRVKQGYRKSDVVYDQSPRAGPDEFLRIGAAIGLNLQRAVPKVVGLDVRDARRQLRLAGFLAQHFSDYSDSDTVLRQLPAAGQPAAPAAKVALTLKRPVPSVRGKRLANAKRLLSQAKLVSAVSGSASESANHYVYDQSPATNQAFAVRPDAPSSRRFEVKLELGSRVPSLSGRTLSQADSQLRGLRLEPRLLNDKPRLRNVTYRVVSQNMEEGRVVPFGTKVGFRIGADNVRVPAVENLTVQQARVRLSENGLKAEFDVNQARDNDRVAGQDPAPGRSVKPGGSVRLAPLERFLPDTTNSPWRAAIRELRSSGFSVSAEGSGDRVLRQTPSGATRVRISQLVKLVPGVVVPSGLDGQTVSEAFERLRDRGLEPVTRSTDTRPTTERELQGRREVARLSPSSGSLVARGASIQVDLIEYRFNDPRVRVPQLVGRDCREAQQELSRLGLRVRLTHKRIITQNRAQIGRHEIASQSIQPFISVEKGTLIAISCNIYEGVQLRIVPDVVGGHSELSQPVDAGINTVKRAGLTPIILFRGQRYNETTWGVFVLATAISAPRDLRSLLRSWRATTVNKLPVRGQQPRAGTRVPAGSHVVIEVQSYGPSR